MCCLDEDGGWNGGRRRVLSAKISKERIQHGMLYDLLRTDARLDNDEVKKKRKRTREERKERHTRERRNTDMCLGEGREGSKGACLVQQYRLAATDNGTDDDHELNMI